MSVSVASVVASTAGSLGAAALNRRPSASPFWWRKVLRTGAAAVVLASAIAAVSTGPGASVARAGSGSPPNVVIFMTDDQRTDTMRVMPKTEKWFRRRGVSYPKAFTTTPLCCPARASLFTGQYVHNHGVHGNPDGPSIDQGDTLQRYLHDAGYHTALAGKYFNTWDISTPPPHFDRFAMLRQGNDAFYDSTFNVDGSVRVVSTYSTQFIRRRALEYLRSFDAQDEEAPWLLIVTPFAPHTPAFPSPRYEDAPIPRWRPTPADLEKDRSDKPPLVQEQHRGLRLAERIRARQLRSLMSVDDLVDSVMRTIRDLGEASRTLAFFLSDNGYLWAEHGWQKGKRVGYDPAIRIPFFARWPGRLAPGTVDPRIVANVDIAPTILDATGIDPKHVVDGRSLLGAWQRDRLLIEYFQEAGVPPWASTWTPRAQYVEWYEEDETTVSFREYYALNDDPWQLRNLLGDRDAGNDPAPGALTQLGVQLAADRRCVGTSGASACP